MMTASLPGPELQAGHQQPAGSAERGQPLGQQLPQPNITVTIYTIYTLSTLSTHYFDDSPAQLQTLQN